MYDASYRCVFAVESRDICKRHGNIGQKYEERTWQWIFSLFLRQLEVSKKEKLRFKLSVVDAFVANSLGGS